MMPQNIDKKLSGVKIAVTRPTIYSDFLVREIRNIGGAPVFMPAIEISPMVKNHSNIYALAQADHIIFISRSAARIGASWFLEIGKSFAGTRVYAIGGGTESELLKLGFKDIITPKIGHDSESLLALPSLQAVTSSKITIVRGQGGREKLEQILTARGAYVDYLECYKREKPAWRPSVIRAVNRKKIGAWLATSGEIIDNIFAMEKILDLQVVRQTPWFVTHPRLSISALSRYKVNRVFVTQNGDIGLINCLKVWF